MDVSRHATTLALRATGGDAAIARMSRRVSLPDSAPPRERWASLGLALALVAVTLLAYAPAIRADFIWNDSDYVTAPSLQSVDGLARIWFEFGATEQYYPLLHSAFWLE